MVSRLFTLFLLLASAITSAQSIPDSTRLMASADAEKPIQLQSLRISGELSGGMAQTTVQMVFFNPNPRPLEGHLQFPLLAGQQITGFALDVDGKLRPAVPVEKAKGRQIFEAIERRNIDPALLENTQGSNFKLRVYPIAALGTRMVELKYAEALPRDGMYWSYRLPLAYGERLQEFDLTLKVHGNGAVPKVSGALGAVSFSRQGSTYQAHVAKSRFAPSGMLNIVTQASVQPQTYIQEHDGHTYFVAEIPVSTKRAARPLPKIVGLLWDSSGSGAARARDAELAELDRYFKAVGNAEVRLTRLRDRAESTAVFHIVDGNWEALRNALQNTVYDGASALAGWQPQADVEEYLLVSDGLLNYGASRFPELAAGQRLYALNSSLAADTGRLAALAERSGGRLVQVLPDKPGAAAQALLTEGAHVRNISAVGATEVLADSPDPQGLLRVAGKLINGSAKLTVTVLQQGQPKDVTLAVSAGAPTHALAAYLWASSKLHALEADFEVNRGAIRRLGNQFAMPTRETSLIVLDRLEDYVRYDVMPPSEYLTAYERMKALRGAELTSKREKHLERVLQEFEQKVAWWEKAYPKGEPPQKAETKAVPMPGQAAPVAMAAPAPVMGLLRQSDAAGAQRAASPTATAREPAPSDIGISLKKWRSDAPYIARMTAASADTLYQVYLDEKPSYANSSAFYLDAADMLIDKGQRDLALRVLSNLAEMDLENRHVLRILGYRLLQADAPELAIPVFEKVQYLAEEEPQSFRDLGLAHAAAKHYQLAIDQLNEVVVRPWDARFAEIELIALAEMNAIIAAAPSQPALDTSRIDARFLKNLPLDLRAVLTWDADNSDMDLWVTDPNGEKCYYAHRFTYQGGRMSRDFTGGYGPEEFSLREAKPGKYRIEANFFGSRQQIVAGATTLQVKLSSGFGTPSEKDQMITLRLKERGNTVFVGEFEVKPK
ncbi:VIT domain-containing protein [Noviherbaspirillum autotrophicum]|uniref:VIT domain-containing protein n=1 Tax=Noviherbaspirillum autotrophicum TaxID=709839 RepID=A0A0C2BVL3_9BURK|nr:VIT domain-containing protein [Noviherbaspirillum autotrophicum]KIF81699.1 hypothetical protein TSA66_14315 [Noviherbaspirillum autotrophicum]KIF82066.1 hypothetical protein TSA66_16680 [Noviherbaspirillum autotrophicum]KIF84140.1 hypothetical protein TSA66_00340 [Noviherbaspirillum autotrophicum]